eukprot:757316-Hanusia_phi.AAC.4
MLGSTASSLHQVVLGRFVSGLAIGTFGTVIPMCVNDIFVFFIDRRACLWLVDLLLAATRRSARPRPSEGS